MFTSSSSIDGRLEKPALKPVEGAEDEVLDVDNDPGNEDPGSQFNRDATVPLISPDEAASTEASVDKEKP